MAQCMPGSTKPTTGRRLWNRRHVPLPATLRPAHHTHFYQLDCTLQKHRSHRSAFLCPTPMAQAIRARRPRSSARGYGIWLQCARSNRNPSLFQLFAGRLRFSHFFWLGMLLPIASHLGHIRRGGLSLARASLFGAASRDNASLFAMHHPSSTAPCTEQDDTASTGPSAWAICVGQTGKQCYENHATAYATSP